MSWDVSLYDDRGHCEGSWNYTHNCNRMIEDALGSVVSETPETFWGSRSWWQLLDGQGDIEGHLLLGQILAGLKADPAKYRAMNPPNGWGDYDSLMGVLSEMQNTVPEWPCRWSASG